ncbi:MAG: DNA topoisomerase IV subunit A [Alphaproteobacteria bacterium]|nr:DNA topoisomerase IV subunit A [Alphaproteobacteria bacterium]MDE2013641.1 DNA topoisomerase IV subunit A [Alphaproteobacteria bacterium]MDE2072630.1 DNA topoisomerase IV subunit A [Alphaproteobacteria bacterium]MDE2350322.1 DNA topoisomerase IV subunit A [Alphaproteobacteria bacterium]
MAEATEDDIRPEPLAQALSERYLAYALSTITQRALPDARDGLKPVHRRLLHAMRELGLKPESGFKKCARVVGDVIGKFHPHGDQAVYDALVRLAQDFAVRYPLVEGQGNFGNVDGDNPAAMRYTESRLTAIAQSLLEGLDEDAVDFRATYDGEDREPVVLPAAFPNLLANGANGIAVGMATSIPPHNLGELCGALVALIQNPNTQERTLFKHVKGPDFPTGGIIVDDPDSIAEAYRTGRGSFRVRARWHREEAARGTYHIVVDQIPYQVQKAKLIEKIAELIEQKKLPLLDDVRDESTEDIRVVLVPKNRTVEPEILMEQLFRQSDLETRVPLNMNVLDNGLIPRVMSLKDALQAFINHRRTVLERRSAHRLEKIAARLDILEGYLAVYLNLDKVIKIIRTEDEPKPKLMAAFKLTETQADAILNMRLRSLRKLEEMEIRREHSELSKEQKALKKLLGSDKLKSDKLIEEVKEIDAKFGLKTALGKRRTQFAKAAEIAKFQAIAEEVVALETQVEREPVTVVCSEKGWLRSLKGHQEQSDAVKYREGDRARFWIHAETTDQLMMFATDGRFFTLDCAKLPGGRGNGEAIRSFIDLPSDADLVSMFVHVPGRKLLLGATSGHGFVMNEDDAVAMKRSGKQAMSIPTGTEAVVCTVAEGDSVAVIGENRKLLIFPLDEVPEMARGRGVILQRYKDGHLLDVRVFTWKQGLKDQNNRAWSASELKEWKGLRAQAGRLPPKGWAKSGKFG